MDFEFQSISGADADVQKALTESTAAPSSAASSTGASACGTPRSKGELKSRGGVTCLLCDAPRKNSSYCGPHKRAYDTVYKAAFSDAGRAKPGGGEGAEWDEQVDSWVGSEHWAFMNIFGDEKERRKGEWRDPQKAGKILIDFVINNPDGKSMEGKRKNRRHGVNLAQYVHTEGCRQSSDQIDGERKVDEELFSNIMKALRGWSSEKAAKAWKEYEADPDIGRDQGGPKWSKLRLFLPGALFGEDRVENRKGIFEEKSLTHMTKPGKMTEAEASAIRDETTKGFKRPFSYKDAVDTMHIALGQNAVTSPMDDKERGNVDMLSLLRGAAAGLTGEADMLSKKAKHAPFDSPSAGRSGMDREDPSSASKGKAVVDIKNERNNAWHNVTREKEKLKGKMGQALTDAMATLQQANATEDTDLISTLEERVVLGAMYLGLYLEQVLDKPGIFVVKPAALDKYEDGQESLKLSYIAGSPVTWAHLVQQVTALGESATQPKKHTAMLRAALGQVAMLPVESPETFLSWSEVDQTLTEEIKAAASGEDLQQKGVQFEQHKVLHEQLRLAIDKGMKSLKKVIGKRAVEIKKKMLDEAKKMEQAKKEALTKKAEIYKAQLAYEAQVACFNIDWKSAGHMEVHRFDSDEELKAAIDVKEGAAEEKSQEQSDEKSEEKNWYNKPFKLGAGCGMLKQVPEKLQTILEAWEDETRGFRKALFTENGAVQHTLTSKQGSAEVHKLMSHYVPKRFDKLTSSELQEDIEKTNLFGYASWFVKHNYEPDLLGSLRLITHGELKFFAVNPSSFKSALASDARPCTQIKAELEHTSTETESLASDRTMGTVLKNMTAAKANELSVGGCTVSFGSLIAGEALFVPPGWFVGTAAGGNTSVSGVRVSSFMKVGRAALHSVREAGEPEHAKVATVLLDMLSLKQG